MLPRLTWLLVALLLLVPGAGAARSAQPLDLDDARPREVRVRFALPSRDEPAGRAAPWTQPLPARLEPMPGGRVRVRVPAPVVEAHLFDGEGAVPGSFGDFLWVFDAESGEVLSASLQGTLRRSVGPGFLHLQRDVEVDVTLSTRRPLAFREGREVLGELVHAPCKEPGASDCRRLTPAPLDPRTGRVHAVGVVRARSGPFGSRSLGPFGRAVFLEAGESAPPRAPAPPSVAAGPPERLHPHPDPGARPEG